VPHPKIKGLCGDELVNDYVQRFGKDTILAFSCGKDSIAAALALRDHCNMVPVFYYIVPNLPMQEEALDYYERELFGRRILRYPDQRFYDWLHTGVHLPLSHLEIVDACDPPLPDPLHDSGGVTRWRTNRRKWIGEQEGLDERTLIAVGVMAADSPQRFMSFQKHGQIRPSSGAWYPIWDYNREKLLTEIERSGIKLPVDYHLFGRSLDGLSVEYLVPIKRHRPEDWKIILEWFPLAEMEVWKYERFVEGKRAA
jgi:hypothetical protein